MSKKKDETPAEEPRYDPNPAFGADSVAVDPFPVATPVGNPSDEPDVSLLAAQWADTPVVPGSDAEVIKESILAEAALAEEAEEPVEEPAAEPEPEVVPEPEPETDPESEAPEDAPEE